MEQFAVNLSGKVRRATLGGRPYLVAPLTLIVPGVLNGSQGPLFYPQDEINKNPQDWNGVPIVLRHPITESGSHVSARDPKIIENQGLGYVYRAKSNGKLRAEGWFDEENTQRLAPEVLSNLRAGKIIELSTGLFTDNEPAENGEGSYKGKRYTHVARNYRPDHLAILPDQEGACSVKDGCGVNVNQRGRKVKINVFCPTGQGGGIDPSCSGADGSSGKDASGSIPMHNIKVPKSGKISIDQAHSAMKQMGYTLVGTFAESTRYDPKLGSITKFKSPDGKVVEMTSKQVKDAVMAGARNYKEAPAEAARAHAAKFTKNQTSNIKGDPNMAKKLTENRRTKIVEDLIENCGECGWDEEDRETLNSLSDQKLLAMDKHRRESAENALIANAVREAVEPELAANASSLPAFIKEKMAAKGKEEEVCNEDDEECLAKNKNPTKNEEAKVEEKKLTTADVVALLPDDMKANLAFGSRGRAKWRADTIERITANVEDEDQREKLDAKLQSSGDEVLGDMLLVLPKKEETIQVTANYAGLGAGPTANTKNWPYVGIPGEG